MFTYTMEIVIAGTQKLDGHDCWQVEFRPGPDSPKTVAAQQYRVLVDKEDGAVRKVVAVKGEHTSGQVLVVDDCRLVMDAPSGFPLEILPVSRNMIRSANEPRSELRYSKTVEAEFRIKTVLTQKITQKWEPQARWWTEYERSLNGHVDLRARLVNRIDDDGGR
jgi:hypothetical protein